MGMKEIWGIGQLAATAGSLILNEPGDRLLESLQRAGYRPESKEETRQQFFDRLAIPQSGLYLPPYEHVFRQGEQVDGIWHFPPARHDGALAVERVYRSLGFRHHEVPASPLLSGANIPGDHIGFMLVFCGLALEGIADGHDNLSNSAPAVQQFVAQHLGEWVDAFCKALPLNGTRGYLAALADAIEEAVALLRAWSVRTVTH